MSEAHVYITLPGATQAVTAGRFEHEIDRDGVAVGRFVYDGRYQERADAVEIDPVALRLGQMRFETERLNGVFGALRDAAPDYWGRQVIETQAGIHALGELDYLLRSSDDRAGALSFGPGDEPPAPSTEFNKIGDLDKLQSLVDALISDPTEHGAAGLENLPLLGTGMGGARPKVVVEHDDALWLAKFNRADDRWNMARVEHATLVLARRCGLQVADSQVVTVGGKDMLLVRRFDRERAKDGYTRARMVSALTLLETDETPDGRSRWSYALLAETLQRISERPREDAHELFCRMTFNALISNTDDHPRNHAAIALGRSWRLSPAYDLTPTPSISQDRRDLAMACGAQGRFANAENLLSECGRFLLNTDQAIAMITKMEHIVTSEWHPIARDVGASEVDCAAVSRSAADRRRRRPGLLPGKPGGRSPRSGGLPHTSVARVFRRHGV